MVSSEFTSGPVRDLTSKELGVSDFSDFELLSDSGHNLVYRAMCGGKWVVLKCAKVEEGNTIRNQQLLRREYDIMRAIDSLYVVRTWQMTDVPELGMAIVMEYVHGRTLDAFLQEKPSYSERKRITEELLEALIALHERQIVHGDLKGTNILITDAGNHVRLIDFGFADTDAYIAKNIGTTPSILPSGRLDLRQPSEDHSMTADIQRDIYAFGKILSRLFPHRFKSIRKRCLKGHYLSIKEVRKALSRSSLILWLILFVCFAIIVAVSIIGLFRSGAPDVPKEDAKWQILKQKAEMAYEEFYRLSADSLTNMAEPEYYAAREIVHHYAISMYNQREQFLLDYPEYEEQLIEQQSAIYSRDYQRLNRIMKNYQVKD